MRRLIPILSLLAACSVEGTPLPPDPPSSPYAGTWLLQRVSGQPLPATESTPDPINPNTHIRDGRTCPTRSVA
jgi:hypothetical protein